MSMRTTVTLRDDVAYAVEEQRRASGRGVSDVVNDLIRRGLTREPEPDRRFRQRTSPMRARVDVTNVAEVLDAVEGPGAR